MKNDDIYPYEQVLRRLLKRIDTELDGDSGHVKEWYLHLKTDKHESLSLARIVKLLDNIIRCSNRFKEKFDKRLIDATVNEIRELIVEVQDRDVAEYTKRDYNIAIKKYLTFLGKKEMVDWIKTSVNYKKRKLPEDLLTEDEVDRMVAVTQNPRDKAFFSLLDDSGLRIGEVLNLRIKDIYFDDYGAYLIVPDGKTGARRVRLITSIHYLKNWIENHPKPDRESWLFVTMDKHADRLVYTSARKTIKTAMKAAGIKKRVHAHLFRHTAATKAASFMTEQEMKVHFGWEPGSKMAAIYVAMTGEQVENKLLTHYGLKKIEDNGSTLIKCPKCSKLNPKTAMFCNNCSCILDSKLMAQSDDLSARISKVKDFLFESQEFMQLLQKALVNM